MKKISWKKGILSGFKTTWVLGKVIFPITFIITLLGFTPVLQKIVDFISPVMKVFGLPGEAAVPLVLGNFLNLYAGIGGILSLDLTVKEVFIIAVMLSFAHNIFIETSVALSVGVRLWVVLLVRYGLAFISAIIINIVWSGGDEIAKYGFAQMNQAHPNGVFEMILLSAEKAAMGILQLAIIVIPLMFCIQIMKDLRWMDAISKRMGPVTRSLGMSENTSFTLLSGLVFGLAYGAGVMIQAVREDGVSRKDATLAIIFLVACHAVVEDTIIFIPLGIPVIYLLLIRLIVAILLTMLVAYAWRRADMNKRKEATYGH
ncbi:MULTISPECIES: nucleoside recognition domain-containing protein [Bacillus]|uniref:nucleoside recognition domain-containing protein n=1 Tax=Bacillus TaxID=1386 RepID=UPI0002D5336E|nr:MULTISPECIES: nucleoside recognition domain-containing protein [Bacillus]